MSAETLLSRLDAVRQTGNCHWTARCPAHDDSKPSLSIREADDGRTLVYCFAGCSTTDILAAVGLSWSDLFLPRSRTDPPARRRRELPVSASDALRVLACEVTVCALVARDLTRGEAISEADRARLLTAANRIAKVESLCS